MTREVEARLKLSAIDKTSAAFSSVQKKIAKVEQTVSRLNRVQNAVNRSISAMPIGAYVGPAALAYGAGKALTAFAAVERQMTRTGLTLNVTRKQMSDLRRDMVDTAQTYALPVSEVSDLVDAYVAAGAELEDVRKDMGGLAKASQALGASGEDVVKSWDTARKVFGIASQDAEKFFDIVGAGAAAGKIEARDMAQFLPSLLPVAARYNMSGLEDTERLVAALESMADYVGSPSEAATSMNDFLEKLSSPDVERNFKKFGIDLPKRLREAEKEGRDLFSTMHDLLTEATKGDPTRIGQLFGDKEARRGADMILNRIDAIESALQRIRDAKTGLIDRNTEALLDNAQAKLEKMHTTFDEMALTFGQRIAESGVTDVMDWFNTEMQKGAAIDRALDAQGMTPAEKSVWKAQSNFYPEERDAMARKGGYVSPEERRAIKHYGEGYQHRIAGSEYQADKATPQNLPDGGSAPVPTFRSDIVPAEAADQERFDRLFDAAMQRQEDARNRESERQQRIRQTVSDAQAYDTQLPYVAPRERHRTFNGEDFTGGFDNAGALAEAISGKAVGEISGAGKDAGDELRKGGQDAASAIGDAISSASNKLAAALRSAVSDIKVRVQTYGGVDANTGRSAPNAGGVNADLGRQGQHAGRRRASESY